MFKTLKRIYRKIRDEPLNGEIFQQDSILSLIPDDLLENVIIDVFEGSVLNLTEVTELQYVCKRFYRIMSNGYFIDKFLNITIYYLNMVVSCI